MGVLEGGGGHLISTVAYYRPTNLDATSFTNWQRSDNCSRGRVPHLRVYQKAAQRVHIVIVLIRLVGGSYPPPSPGIMADLKPIRDVRRSVTSSVQGLASQRELRRVDRREAVVRALPHHLLHTGVPEGALGLGRTQEGLRGDRAGAPRHAPRGAVARARSRLVHERRRAERRVLSVLP